MSELRGIQKLLKWLPKPWQLSAVRESLNWILTCRHCGAETTVWDMGGIRWRASGSKAVLCKCPTCGSTGWNTLHKRVDGPA